MLGVSSVTSSPASPLNDLDVRYHTTPKAPDSNQNGDHKTNSDFLLGGGRMISHQAWDVSFQEAGARRFRRQNGLETFWWTSSKV